MVTRISLLLIGFALSQSVNAQDAALGKSVFRQCQGCHAVGPGAGNLFGPQLNGLASRNAAAAEGYDYSQALTSAVAADRPWDNESLDSFLEAPMEYTPGTKMVYPGVKGEAERAAVIAWLRNISQSGELIEAEVSTKKAVEKISDSATAVQEPNPVLPKDRPVPEHGQLHLGRVALDEEIQAWDIDIRPDGAGLPAGSGSVADGGELYDAQCAVCHGDFGEGTGRWPMLAGGFDSLEKERPEKTIGSYWPYLSTVFDYVRRAMPFGNARSLSDDDVYALTAYLLYLNDLADDDFTLSSENFASVRLPNEANFIADNRSNEAYYAPASEPCMAKCMDAPATVSMRARVLDVTPTGEAADDGSAAGVVD